ncbi:VOC family protein [Herpetosiphon llansteffanensis]|uniref:VOC family protein n=1 Tax=Herpetosiphon llansteffanensis TaxID=2094568 RepID=UPI000D7C1734|nr:VOC family protein [Herpetosiphon llansteffanensis]
MEMDHVAVVVNNIAESTAWYVAQCGAQVLYADDTWAFLRIGQGKLALVMAYQHPPHVAVRVDENQLNALAAQHNQPIDRHRDGTKGFYLRDPNDNVLEVICYPPAETVYTAG